jgi:hypothetical protein
MTQLIDLTKKVKVVLEKKKIFGEKAQIVIAVDISGSMYSRFSTGKVQELLTRLLAIGMNMDDDKAIDVFAFNTGGYSIAQATEHNIEGFVNNVFLRKVSVSGGTKYAPVMSDIVKKFGNTGGIGKFFGMKRSAPVSVPTFVFFITDGDNFDKPETEKLIKDAANQAIFWQFVGIGSERFEFLQKLDDLSGRLIDNADFFAVNDISSISDDELYDRLLTEVPSWLKEARSKGVLGSNG